MSEFRELTRRLVEAAENLDCPDSCDQTELLQDAIREAKALLARGEPEPEKPNENMRAKFDRWYKSPRGEAQFTHYLGWAYICYAEGYKQSAVDREPAAADKARELFTREEWTEKDGEVLWWHFPIEESPHIGSPLDDYWGIWSHDWYTHWTRIPMPSPPAATGDQP